MNISTTPTVVALSRAIYVPNHISMTQANDLYGRFVIIYINFISILYPPAIGISCPPLIY